jgi:uncharacterized protein YfdQ (DUF2303 family)
MTTEAESVATLARKTAAPTTIKTEDGREFLIYAEGSTVCEISDEHSLQVTAPRYIKQAVTLQTQDSLIGYVKTFKTPATLLFADIGSNAIVGLIDYHAPDKAAHIAHKAVLTLPFSEEWRIWNDISGKLKPQLEFARFLEENAADVRAPSAGDLLDACRDLQVHRKVNFIKAVRTASDNENFEYTEETNATNKKSGLEIPTKFVLGLPVYFGEEDTEVSAFLRWRLDDGSLTLGIQLHRVEHVRQAVFKQIVTAVAEATECPAVFGKL